MEQLKHECGVAIIRLLKPLEYYERKYGTWMYGLNKLYLLMEKQHNRGQEGAGLAVVKLKVSPGNEYMFRERAEGSNAITEIFSNVYKQYESLSPEKLHDTGDMQSALPFAGEVYMGHLRYSTTGKSGISYIHPFLRRNNWRAKNLALCGNFNMTNVDEIFDEITSNGQHPRAYTDTFIMLEQVGHRLDRETERLYRIAEEQHLEGRSITEYIENRVCMENVLQSASKCWDGGYVICGVTGSGESFALRDPWGIRTAFWYADDEVVVIASERPVIQTVFNARMNDIKEVKPGEAILINKSGLLRAVQINAAHKPTPCSFERIYFSRGSDADIYKERKNLGKELVPQILSTIGNDIDNTVFSFIPNTAEVAFYGMLQGLDRWLNQQKVKQIVSFGPSPTTEELQKVLSRQIRYEKVAIKDVKLRTFITESNSRNDLAAHVYDITYGSIRPEMDNLVIIDDSIVRGTTLRQSIISILSRLQPKKIIIVSSSPQVRYPDYYGIDMSHLAEFVAFRAAISLLEKSGREEVIYTAYGKAKAQESLPASKLQNYVKEIYAAFSDEELTKEIANLLVPSGMNTEIEIVYQSIEGLHKACPEHPGDWYFSGEYPTAGGLKLLNDSFIDFMENTYKHTCR